MKRELSPLCQVESMGLCKYAVFFNFNHQQSHKGDFAHLSVCFCAGFCVYIYMLRVHIACLNTKYIAGLAFHSLNVSFV